MDVSVSEGAVLCLLCLAFISLIKATWGEETLPLAAWLLQKERDLASQLLMSSPRAPKASRTTWLTKPKQAYRQFYLSTHLQSSIISQGRKGQTSLLSILALWLPWKLSFWGEMGHFSLNIQSIETERRCALQSPGNMCLGCNAVMTHPFKACVGAMTLGSLQPQLSPFTARLLWPEPCLCLLPHQCMVLSQRDALGNGGQWCLVGHGALTSLLLPLQFLLHLSGLWAPQGGGSSPQWAVLHMETSQSCR